MIGSHRHGYAASLSQHRHQLSRIARPQARLALPGAIAVKAGDMVQAVVSAGRHRTAPLGERGIARKRQQDQDEQNEAYLP